MALARILYYKHTCDRNLHKTRKALLQLREQKFRKLLKYAFHNSPFYRTFYTDHGIFAKDLDEVAITDLPPIDKKLMMEHFDELVIPKNLTRQRVEAFLEKSQSPREMLDSEYRVIHSSGSSATVGYYLYNPKSWDLIKAVSLRMFAHFGIKPKNYLFIGAADGHYAGVSVFISPIGSLEGIFYRNYQILDINKPIEQHTQVLNKLKPDIISGYSTAIKMLAALQQQGKLSIYPQAVICGGEPVTPDIEALVHEIWNCELINFFAASESLVLGVEREDLDGFYLFDDLNYIEFETNTFLLTNLYNFTQPLIRYRMQDTLVPLRETGKWPFTRIKKIIGRQEDLLWFTNQRGNYDFIHPIVIAELYVKGLTQYQLIKTGDKSFTFKAVIAPYENKQEVLQKLNKRLQQILSKKAMQNINYHIEVVNSIARDPVSGKFRLCVHSG